MQVLNVFSLLLTVFTLITYSVISIKTEHSTAFFLCVEIIALIANLCTITGGAWMMAILYIIVSAAFLGLSFVVDKEESIAYYRGMGPWFKSTFAENKDIGFQILSFLLAPVGIVLYFVWYHTKPELSRKCGKMGAWGILLWLVLLWLILGMISGSAAPDPEEITNFLR